MAISTVLRILTIAVCCLGLFACGTTRPSSDNNRLRCNPGEARVCKGKTATRLESDDAETCMCVIGSDVDKL